MVSNQQRKKPTDLEPPWATHGSCLFTCRSQHVSSCEKLWSSFVTNKHFSLAICWSCDFFVSQKTIEKVPKHGVFHQHQHFGIPGIPACHKAWNRRPQRATGAAFEPGNRLSETNGTENNPGCGICIHNIDNEMFCLMCFLLKENG